MKKVSWLLLLTVALFEFGSMNNHSPTIQMRITNFGLEFISQLITKILNQKCNFMIPFMDLSDPPLQINITNATISEFIPPNLKMEPKSPHGIHIKAINGSFKLHTLFTTFLPLIFKTVTVTGEADVNASNFIVKLEMDVLAENFHPLIKLRNCAVNIKNINVVYHSNSNLLDILSTMKSSISQIVVRKINIEVSEKRKRKKKRFWR
uniref:Lipid-binding serum glycoprotein N-terminal domain-containing protein n=1 Tax=Wuchereria bancrofti TaxID=6293 RepID=A0A1I8EMY5_WUCBA